MSLVYQIVMALARYAIVALIAYVVAKGWIPDSLAHKINIDAISMGVAVVVSAVLIAAATSAFAWVKAKLHINIALQLPRGATETDVTDVADRTPTLTTTPNPVAVTQVARDVVASR